MQPFLSWRDIVIRLLLTLIAGSLVGLNRGEHGRPAGLRTTLMVCLGAAVAMILANLLLCTAGKRPDSFVNIDPMRLPLGVLTGMGFIGAGAVLHRKDTVIGLTTAATLWFVTIVGLCFGAGQIFLGAAATILALLVLEGLWRVDRAIRQDRHATLLLLITADGPTQEKISEILKAGGFWIATCDVSYGLKSRRTLKCEVRWRGRLEEYLPPPFLDELVHQPGVLKLRWRP